MWEAPRKQNSFILIRQPVNLKIWRYREDLSLSPPLPSFHDR